MGFSFGGPVADEGGVDFCAQNISLMFLNLYLLTQLQHNVSVWGPCNGLCSVYIISKKK